MMTDIYPYSILYLPVTYPFVILLKGKSFFYPYGVQLKYPCSADSFTRSLPFYKADIRRMDSKCSAPICCARGHAIKNTFLLEMKELPPNFLYEHYTYMNIKVQESDLKL